MSITPAERVLKAAKVAFVPHTYRYVDRGGAAHAAAELNVDLHRVIKTIVLQTGDGRVFIVLQHGDRDISTKDLARHLGVKTVTPCTPEAANRATGYLVGGTSPLGTRRRLDIYAERSIAGLDRIYVNGGRRGFLVELATTDLLRLLEPVLVDTAIDRPSS